jgi:hypothetical protein
VEPLAEAFNAFATFATLNVAYNHVGDTVAMAGW